MRRNAARVLIAALGTGVLAAACGGAPSTRLSDLRKIGESYSSMDASSVKPPRAVDVKAVSLPGFIVATNSNTWNKMPGVQSPSGRGAVVLFIQPGGPTDNHGIARGDLLVAVDGQPVANNERAIALLHSRVGQERRLTFKRRNGKTRTITIIARNARGDVRAVLNPMIEANPNDPVAHFLRAYQPGGTYDQNITDLDAALRAQPDFVEAMWLRAELVWTRSLGTRDPNERRHLQAEALAGWKNALDIDPQNEIALTLQADALNSLGRAQAAEATANHALKVDGTLPLALYELARSRFLQNRPQQAAGPALGAVELNPYSTLYYTLLEQVFMKLKRPEDCRKTSQAFVPYLEARTGAGFKAAADQLKKVCQ